ncbi:MAG: TMEM175 family protein [Actinomycetota bacterium]
MLRRQLDDFLGYFLSFAVLAFYWVAHHRLFDHVKRADRWLLYLNLIFLSFVALLPYPSELLQHYGDTKVATVFWAATIVLAGSAFTALVVHAVRGHLVDPPFERAYRQHAILRHAAVPVVFAASIPVAFLSVAAAKFVWLLLPVCHLVFRRRYGSIHDTH